VIDRRVGSRIVRVALVLLVAACAHASTGGLALNGPEPSTYLSARRLAVLSASERGAWRSYLARSDSLLRLDRGVIAAELRSLGRARMARAPYARESFTLHGHMRGAWFRSDSARRLAANILSFQTPSGGWSKHVAFDSGARAAAMSFFSENERWSYIATIDNNSTTEQMRFLAEAFESTGDQRYRQSLGRGFEYLLAAQYPNGCWPQVYPLAGGYHDAATFNDDATVNVLKVIRDVAQREDRMPGFAAEQRAGAAAALDRGVECILATQVVVGGRRTVWGQQHDPLTLVPVRARRYEPPALAGRESAGITAFLMDLRRPGAGVIQAGHAAVDWLRSNAKYGVEYTADGVAERAGAGPVWARMTEIGTNRPIFSNRDGAVLYDHRLLTDRATGYAWFTTEPAGVLVDYEDWSKRYPHPRGGQE